MLTYINLTLSHLDFMSLFYRLLIIPNNLTLFLSHCFSIDIKFISYLKKIQCLLLAVSRSVILQELCETYLSMIH